MKTHFDIIPTDQFLIFKDIGSAASLTLTKHGGKLPWATEILKEVSLCYHKMPKEIDAKKIFSCEFEKISTIFNSLVANKKADYFLLKHSDGGFETYGSDWNHMFAPCRQKREIEAKLADIEVTPEDLEHIKKCDWTDPYFMEPVAYEKAKKALFDGNIHQYTAAKILLGHDILKAKLPIYTSQSDDLRVIISQMFAKFTHIKQDQIYQLLQDIGITESQFTLIDCGDVKGYERIRSFSDIKTIYQLVARNIRTMVGERMDKKFIFLAPPLLHLKIMQILFGPKAMIPNPVVGGLSDPDCFANSEFRDVLIPSPGIPSPDTVHEKKSDGLGNFIHDLIGHNIAESSLPVRTLLVKIAEECKDMPSVRAAILDRNVFEESHRMNAKRFLAILIRIAPQINKSDLETYNKGCHKMMEFWCNSQPLFETYNISLPTIADIDSFLTFLTKNKGNNSIQKIQFLKIARACILRYNIHNPRESKRQRTD